MAIQFGGNNVALNTIEAAALLGLSASSLSKWRLTGDGPRYVKAGRRVMYRLADLMIYQEANLRSSTSDPGAGR